MTAAPTKKNSYTADDVKNLSGRDAVRLRPGMYIGGKDSAALAHIVAEMIDNSVDEYMQGACTDIWVEIAKDQTVTVRDNGRGMPLEEKTTAAGVKMPAPQMLVSVLHSGGKFGQGSYDASGGLHGVGLKAGNYMSTSFVIDIWRDGQHYHQEFSDGSLKVSKPVIKPHKGKETGTQISFRFDPAVFSDGTHVDAERIVAKLRDASYPCPGLSLHFFDARTGAKETFKAERGIVDLVERMADDNKPLLKSPIHMKRDLVLEKGDDRNWTAGDATFGLELAMLPTDDSAPTERTMGYTNTIANPDGGDHVSGAKTGLARGIKRFMTKHSLTKGADSLESLDILQGLALVVSVRMTDPMFASQHKTRLAVQEVNSLTAGLVDEFITDYLETHDKDAKAWAKNIEDNRIARLEYVKTKKTLRSQRGQTINTLLNKLERENSGCPPERAELFLVEGDSAGGTAGQARDSKFQAVLKTRGKGLNVWKAKKLSQLVSNKELATLSAAIGLEYRTEYDPSQLKYHKIVFLADADADGGHINLLWLSVFYREWPQLITDGHVYIARPPLYSVTPLKGKNKDKIYVHNETDLKKLLGNHADDFLVSRFKGLGEMNADQLREVALDPATRILQQVTYGEAQFAHEMLSGVMGDDASFRRDYLRRSGDRANDEMLANEG